MIAPLDWYPKAFGTGDHDGSSTTNMLGVSDLTPLEILIRETAQNSWDARLDDHIPVFGVNLRRMEENLRESLTTLFRHDTPGSNLVQSLADPHARILEIYDRGTCGLDGPIDMSIEEPRNFQDLILKVGVPRSDGKGGGTYGFGKTASYAYSKVGTVIFWTRCRNKLGQLEHRFIASAFRDSYQIEGTQFTGRHWWGTTKGANEHNDIYPLVGEAAEKLGNLLFERKFAEGETGTSLLIISPTLHPQREHDDPEEQARIRALEGATLDEHWAQRTRKAIRQHLWPKLIPFPGRNSVPMIMELTVDGEKVDLGDNSAGAITLWGAALNSIRARRLDIDAPPTSAPLPVKIVEIVRKSELLGHLAFVPRIPELEPAHQADDLDPLHEGSGLKRLVLMRGQAELVVTTKRWGIDHPMRGMDWLAVFKSADNVDHLFAAAEPPAHDDWVPDGSTNDEVRLVVNFLQRKIRDEIKSLVADSSEAEDGTGVAKLPLGQIAKKLGNLLPPEVRAGEHVVSAGRRATKRRAKSIPWIVHANPPWLVDTHSDGTQIQEVEFEVSGPDERAIVELQVSIIGDDNRREVLPHYEVQPKWGEPAVRLSANQATVPTGKTSFVQFNGTKRRALQISLSARSRYGDN